MSGEGQQRGGKQIAMGIAVCFLLNVLHLGIGLLFLLPGIRPGFRLALFGLGFMIGTLLIGGFALVQLVYVIPLVRNAREKGRPDFAKGVIIGASVAFLLTAACWGNVFFQWILAHG